MTTRLLRREKFWNKDFEISLLGGYQGPDIWRSAPALAPRPDELRPVQQSRNGRRAGRGNRETALEDCAVHYRRIQETCAEDLPALFSSDKGVLYPLKTYVHGHPAKDAKDLASESEYTLRVA